MMKMTKEELFEAALALNGDDKKYEITVKDDKIITRVKWMDATFFSPDSVTEEMKEFEYTVRVSDHGKYTELDQSVSVTKSADRGGIGMKKSIFVGKQITFSKTVGVGKDNQTGETGVISNTFYSEEYKKPVRTLLKESGYKKKMGALGKVFLFSGIFVLLVAIVVTAILLHMDQKTPITADDFEALAASQGYETGEGLPTRFKDPHLETVRLAVDRVDAYQVEFYDYKDADLAKQAFADTKKQIDEYFASQNITASSSSDLQNYQKYAVTTDAEYLYTARIKDTIVYVNTGLDAKAEAEAFVQSFGY